MSRFYKIYGRLIRYAIFMGVIGGMASFIGPPRNGLIKAHIGIVVGAMLLGRRLTGALKDLKDASDEISDEIFRE